MKNKLGTDVQYIEINFILVGNISLAAWSNSNLFPEKWICVKKLSQSPQYNQIFPIYVFWKWINVSNKQNV